MLIRFSFVNIHNIDVNLGYIPVPKNVLPLELFGKNLLSADNFVIIITIYLLIIYLL